MMVATGPGWELRCGDCLDPETGLASLESVDHVICDPPFEAEAHSKGRRVGKGWNNRQIVTKAIGYKPIDEETRKCASAEIARVAARWILVFCQAEAHHKWSDTLSDAGCRHIRVGIYWKDDAQPQYSGDRPGVGWEAIQISHGADRCRWNAGGKCARWKATREGRRDSLGDHKAPQDGAKPLLLMEALVADFTDPAELICDPFAGSGTTGVAAIRLGRRFIGWEKDPEFFKVAVKRLESTREQLGLFDYERAAQPKPKQLGLLDTVDD